MKLNSPPARWLLLGALLACQGQDAASEREHAEDEDESATRPAAAHDRVELSEGAVASLGLTHARAELRELTPSLEFPAELRPIPDQHATIGSRVSGRVVEVLVNPGDAVTAGQIVVELESAEVGRARAELVAARARARVRGSAARRAGQLHSERISPKRTVEEARGEQSVANAELQAARTRLRAYGVEPDHVDDGHGPSRVAIASPLAGTVVKRAAHVGQWAEPTHNLVEVASLDALWLEAAVYERELRFVHPGQEVTVEVRAFPGEVFKGTVALVDAMLDPRTRSAGVRVELPNPGHRLKPGMFATARVEGTHAHAPRRLLAIPWSAIQEVDGHQAVFARVGERAYELRRVHTGERAGDDVEILDGLAPGDEVAALGSFLLKGQLLRETLGEDE